MFGSTGGGVVNTGDNSLASDFSREGLGNIDTDEVDPIAEAEVYLAYGRDAQAEEILKDALKKDPQRQEIYLKLLEIHAQHNKPSAFETVASELYAVCNGQGETWHKAVALGRQLDPNNPMFAEGGAPVRGADVHPLAMAGSAGAARQRRTTSTASNSRWTRRSRSRRRPAPRPRRPPTSSPAPKANSTRPRSTVGAAMRSRRRRGGAALAGAMAAGKSATETRAATPCRKGRGRAGKFRRGREIRPRFQARRRRQARADGQARASSPSWRPPQPKGRRAAWRRN